MRKKQFLVFFVLVLLLGSSYVIPKKQKRFEPPIGSIVAFAGPAENVPENWMICDGRDLIRTKYPKLFKAIGTSWGGDGAPKFFVPDLRGMFLRGVDKDINGTSAGRDPDRDNRVAPQPTIPNPGNEKNNVGSIQLDATRMPRDDKNKFKTNGAGGHTHSFRPEHTAGGTTAWELGSWTIDQWVDGSKHLKPVGDHTHSITGGDHETRPVNAYVYWIIRVK